MRSLSRLALPLLLSLPACTAILGSFEVDPTLNGGPDASSSGGSSSGGDGGSSSSSSGGDGGSSSGDAAAEDPKNCGSPGHDCERGACVKGVCQPYTLASFGGGTADLSVQQGGGDVFVIERPATLWRVARSLGPDGGTTRALAGQFGGAYEFRGVSTHPSGPDTYLLTFASGSTQLRKVEAGGLTPFGPATTITGTDVAITPTKTFFIALESAPNGGAFEAKSAAYTRIDGDRAQTIAAEDNFVFWSEQDGSIHARDPANATTALVASAQGKVRAMSARPAPALGQFDLVWGTDSGTGAVRTCTFRAPIGPCSSPVDLASNQKTPADVLVFDKRVFWIEQASGTVASCDFGDCGKTTIVHAKGEDVPSRIAEDGRAIFFITKSELRKVVR